MKRPYNKKLQARENLMAELAEKIAQGKHAIFHGSRHIDQIVQDGVLYPSLIGEPTISFTRSAEIAAYFALMPGNEIDLFSGGVLVLDRRRLRRYHDLERFVYEDDNGKYLHEEEEQVWDEAVVIKHLLIGIVTEADLDKIFESSGEQQFVGKVFMKDVHPAIGNHECSVEELQHAKESYEANRAQWRKLYGSF